MKEYISFNAPNSHSVLPNVSDEEIEEMYNTIIDIKLMRNKKNSNLPLIFRTIGSLMIAISVMVVFLEPETDSILIGIVGIVMGTLWFALATIIDLLYFITFK